MEIIYFMISGYLYLARFFIKVIAKFNVAIWHQNKRFCKRITIKGWVSFKITVFGEHESIVCY